MIQKECMRIIHNEPQVFNVIPTVLNILKLPIMRRFLWYVDHYYPNQLLIHNKKLEGSCELPAVCRLIKLQAISYHLTYMLIK